MGSTIFMCIEPLTIHYFQNFLSFMGSEGPFFCPKKLVFSLHMISWLIKWNPFYGKDLHFDSWPIREHNAGNPAIRNYFAVKPWGKRQNVFLSQKSCKIRPIIFVRSKMTQYYPSEVRFWVITIGHVHVLRQASQKYLLSTLGLGIEPYGCKIGKMSQKLCPGKNFNSWFYGNEIKSLVPFYTVS